MSDVKPHLRVKTIIDIPYEELKAQGIKVLLFDFDETILAKGEKEVAQERKELLKALSEDFKIIIVSNCPLKMRIKKYISNYPIVARAYKPLSKGFDKALKIAKTDPWEIAMIGDKPLTDILGGNKKGFYTILTQALNPEGYSWLYKLYSKILLKDKEV